MAFFFWQDKLATVIIQSYCRAGIVIPSFFCFWMKNAHTKQSVFSQLSSLIFFLSQACR